MTAGEFKELAGKKSPDELSRKVDVVTTATFGPMCSSGAFINFGHSSPPMRYEKVSLNGVAAYGGIAAADAYIGATEENPASIEYGGAHVIEDLIAGKTVKLTASAKGTDCYPRKETVAEVRLEDVNEAFMFNSRNAYQNYAAATNSSARTMYTYMGTLLPGNGNVTYSTSGELSPLLNDPQLKSIGIGTGIFIGGAHGYIAWNGTQHFTGKERNSKGIPLGPAATISVIGNLKKMNTNFIRAAYYEKYGTTLFVGIGIPFPVTSAEVAKNLSVRNMDIETVLQDYGQPDRPVAGKFNYAQLMSGEIELAGRAFQTAPLSSISKAREICNILKERIADGEFLLSEPVSPLAQNKKMNKLKMV